MKSLEDIRAGIAAKDPTVFDNVDLGSIEWFSILQIIQEVRGDKDIEESEEIDDDDSTRMLEVNKKSYERAREELKAFGITLS